MLSVAKILKSNGTTGDVLVGLSGVDAGEFKNLEPVFVEFDGLPVPFFIETIRPKGTSRAIVHLSGIDSLRDAEEITGRDILADCEEEESDYEDFTGWTLYNGEAPVGVVDGLEDIPGNPCLCVGDALIPLHEDLIVSADANTRVLVMSLPEGLI